MMARVLQHPRFLIFVFNTYFITSLSKCKLPACITRTVSSNAIGHTLLIPIQRVFGSVFHFFKKGFLLLVRFDADFITQLAQQIFLFFG